MVGLTDRDWERIIDDVANIFIKAEINRQGVSASGKLVQSIKSRGNKMVAIDYVEWADRGRGPGGMPPVDKLIEWAQIKLGLSGDDAIGAGWAIANKIKNEGSKVHREGGYSQFLYVLKTRRVMEYIETRAGNILAKQVRAYINTSIKARQKK